MIHQIKYCGFVAIVGRSNVGKSTLLNYLLGQKISITSRKPQTTRHCIMGIQTYGPYQTIYLDTPGLHMHERTKMNSIMNQVAISTMKKVELVIFVVEGINWTLDDVMVLNKLYKINCPVLLVINKIDKVVDKKQLLPHIQFLNQQMFFKNIVLICAKTGTNIHKIKNIVQKELPKAEHLFSKENITNHSRCFMASEIIREKLICYLGDELPYFVTVKIEHFIINNCGSYKFYGIIFVERDSQKKMVIGHKGNKIKIIGIQSRQNMEALFKTRVHLKLWVKVKSGWTNNEYTLHNLGYI